jgi:hypothetical protein
MDSIDRPRGILTKADRRYLENPEEYSNQGAYERRQAIRERLYESLYDFSLLVNELDEETRREVFAGEGEDDREQPINVLHSVVALLYLGLTDTVEPDDWVNDAFRTMIARGVKRAYFERGYSVENVTVNFEVKRGPALDELREREKLDFDEVWQLINSGSMSKEREAEMLTQMFRNMGHENIDPVEVTEYGLELPAEISDPDAEDLVELDDT